MFPAGAEMLFKTVPVTAEEVASKDFVSAVGHPDTANILAGMLGKPVPCNRVSLALTRCDVLYVAQYIGPRLPEGTTVLPEGAKIDFVRVANMQMTPGRCPGQDCSNCNIPIFACCDKLDLWTTPLPGKGR